MSVCFNRTHRSVKQIAKFTLLELLLAFVVLVVMLVTVSLSFRTVILTWRNMAKTTSKTEEKLALTEFSDEYFRNLVVFSYKNPGTGNDEFMFEGESDSMFGCIRRRSNSENRPGLTFFRVFLDEEGVVWLESEKTPFFKDMTEDMVLCKDILSTGVKVIEFSYGYFSGSSLEWANDWKEERLPAAVLMMVEWENGTREVWLRRINGVQEYLSMPAQEFFAL